MATKTHSTTRRRNRKPYRIGKPRGSIRARVQAVGPQRFGIVSVDCAKARSKWMLANFYDDVIIPPTVVEHHRAGLDAAIAAVQQAATEHDLADMLVAVERTGRYHGPVRRAFAAAGFETRIVHPFTTKQYRKAADPGVKTDDNDLAAIHRAAVTGYALSEQTLGESWQRLRLLVRHRRDLVRKVSALCCQIKDHLDAAMPGYASGFAKFWATPAPLAVALAFGSPAAIVTAGVGGMAKRLRDRQIRFQHRTFRRIVDWANNAAQPQPDGPWHVEIAKALNEDREHKRQEILDLERRIAAILAPTPYVLLLSIPGINVVGAAEFAGEAGPIRHYANARCITGRAGLFPSRHQSDEVDHPNGPLVKCANHRLRFAILQAADCLATSNRHFRHLASTWRCSGADPRLIRVRVASRFCRIAFAMVAGRQIFAHPAMRDRHYIVDKLLKFHIEHKTPMSQILADLKGVAAQIPQREHAAEAIPIQRQLSAAPKRRGGVKRLGEILPHVLASLGVGQIEYTPSGKHDPT